MIWEFDDNLKQRKLDLISGGYDAYCLFVLTGNEIKTANELNKEYDYLIATPLCRMVHRSHMGNKYDVQEILLGGYVFLFVEKNRLISEIKSHFNFFRVLSKQNEDGKLFGDDLNYADWVLENEGSISVSQAIKLNGMVKIINGPLKKLEGRIVEYSKRNRNCCIEIELLGQKVNTWLPFEWIDTELSDLKIR